MEPRIQYVESSDGTSIAHWTLGQGSPLVILPDIPVGNFQLQWRRFPGYRNWCERLAEHRRLVGYDARGLGLSGSHPPSYALDAHVSDLEAVASETGLDTFALLGSMHTGAVAVSYAVRHPERVSHLLLWGAYARADDYAASPRIQASRALLERDWEAYVDTVVFYTFAWPDEESGKAAADYLRETTTPEAMRSALAETDRFDVTDLLPAVKAPTLVMNRRKAAWPRLEVAMDLAARIPGARLVAFEGVGPVPWASDLEEIASTIDEFLGVGPPQIEVDLEERVDTALTSRETEVLMLVASGHSNKEIAQQLSLSVHTVQRHVANIYNKIGARGRADATAYALKHRLL